MDTAKQIQKTEPAKLVRMNVKTSLTDEEEKEYFKCMDVLMDAVKTFAKKWGVDNTEYSVLMGLKMLKKYGK